MGGKRHVQRCGSFALNVWESFRRACRSQEKGATSGTGSGTVSGTRVNTGSGTGSDTRGTTRSGTRGDTRVGRLVGSMWWGEGEMGGRDMSRPSRLNIAEEGGSWESGLRLPRGLCK